MWTNFRIWADRRQFLSVRALVMYITLIDTWYAFDWAARFAYVAPTAQMDGMQVAAIIAAVTAPIAALQAFVFKWYTETRGLSDAGNG